MTRKSLHKIDIIVSSSKVWNSINGDSDITRPNTVGCSIFKNWKHFNHTTAQISFYISQVDIGIACAAAKNHPIVGINTIVI